MPATTKVLGQLQAQDNSPATKNTSLKSNSNSNMKNPPSSSSSTSSNSSSNTSSSSNKKSATKSKKKRRSYKSNNVDENSITGGRWTKEEDELLKEAVKAIGPRNWKRISKEFMNGHRTDVQCLHRWNKVLRPGLVKGMYIFMCILYIILIEYILIFIILYIYIFV